MLVTYPLLLENTMTPKQSAVSLGLKRYSTGLPCKFGHNSERYTSTGNCIACQLMHRQNINRALNQADAGLPLITLRCAADLEPVLRDVERVLAMRDGRATALREFLQAQSISSAPIPSQERLQPVALSSVVRVAQLNKPPTSVAPMTPEERARREAEFAERYPNIPDFLKGGRS